MQKATIKHPGPGMRDHSLDNIRFFLILSVVFAHLLEVCPPFAGSQLLYKLIYSFHMPAFIFLFGYNARFTGKRILFRWCLPYLFFQTVYLLFSRFVLCERADWNYGTPYWLLWYLLACIFYQLLLPLLDTENKTRQLLTVGIAFGFSLLVGFVDVIGYFLSLSRFFVFLPFFLLGYYCKKNGWLDAPAKNTRFALLFGSLGVILLSLPFLYYVNLPDGLLYGSYSYAACGGALWMRLAVCFLSLSWIVFLFAGVRPWLNKKVFLLTSIGQNTWPVFLLHGFMIKLLPVYGQSLLSSPWLVLLLSCAILLLLGNKFLSRGIYYISFSWLERLFRKKADM